MNTSNRNRNRIGIIIASLSLAALACLPLGCASTTTITPGVNGGPPTTNTMRAMDWQKTTQVISTVGQALAPVAIQKCPQCVPWFKDAIVVLNMAIQNGHYEPEALRQAVITAGVKEIRGPEAEAALQSLFSIYQIYYGDVVTQKLNQQEWVLPVLTAIRDVLQAAVNTPLTAVESRGVEGREPAVEPAVREQLAMWAGFELIARGRP